MRPDPSERAKEEGSSVEDDPFAKLELQPGLLGRLRNWFLAGVLVTAPIGITIWITWSLIDFVDNRVRPFIPAPWDPDNYLPFSLPGLGVLLVLTGLMLIGMFTAGLLGRWIMNLGERLLARVPVVRSIYSAAKQVMETLFADRSEAFREVVLVEYPERGTWVVAFVTAQTRGEIQRRLAGEVISIFVPAVPNPTTGFLLFVPREDVRPLDMTVEQGLKLVISGGIVTPDKLAATAGPPERPAMEVPQRAPRMGLLLRLRNYLLAGILVTAPAAITFWLVTQFIGFVDSRVTPLLPLAWRPETYLPIGVPGLGVVIAVVVLTLIGMFAAGMIGRWILRTATWVFRRLPFVGAIYIALKQLVETVLASRSDAFREVVLFQYPRPGSWAIGLVTGKIEGQVQEFAGGEVINVFLATTPNPTSGFLMFVPRKDTIPMTMPVEDAMKMIISGGLVVPFDPEEIEAERLEAKEAGDEPPKTVSLTQG
ncbi:MAG TPA: DUF502 domain-containing protein [Kiloniellales bacterium]|nr:DUF502 domain-containing protein [Kiloniellales bacterium]